MSANNQILIKQHKDKWYLFDGIQAESWCDDWNTPCDKHTHNTISLKDGKEFSTEGSAIYHARKLMKEDYYEYGYDYVLVKDGAEVNIKE